MDQAKSQKEELGLSQGAVMKQSPNSQSSVKKLFEFKVNITESEIVVVEDVSDPDTRTVILKTTAVFAYRPNHHSEKPISCSLQSIEVFSCQLSKPEDSALSIVDPVAFLVELKSVNLKNANTSQNITIPVLEVSVFVSDIW